jgi:hypothetical protein
VVVDTKKADLVAVGTIWVSVLMVTYNNRLKDLTPTTMISIKEKSSKIWDAVWTERPPA